MIIHVRDYLKNTTVTLEDIGKTTKVNEIRQKAALEFGIDDPTALQLIYSGKIMDDEQILMYYRVEDQKVIMARIIPKKDSIVVGEASSDSTSSFSADTKPKYEEPPEKELEPAESEFFDIGDAVDVQDETGAWYEARIEKICKESDAEDERPDDDGLVYFCKYEQPQFGQTVDQCKLRVVRPRATEKLDVDTFADEAIPVDENQEKIRYLVNYNMDKPGELGNWYEATLESVPNEKRSKKILMATIAVGTEITENCKITKLDEIYIIPQRRSKNKSPKRKIKATSAKIPLRTILDCLQCYDNPKAKPKCHYCRCVKCGTDDDNSKLLICDECAEMYHTYCLDPKLSAVPDEDWYCDDCKNDDTEIVRPGESSKLVTKRMKKMASASAKRHGWGGSRACDGVANKCDTVPLNHFGPIPGMEVGTCWRWRKLVSAAGVHRPPVGGIHGRESDGARSIVFSGGYDADKDFGDKIIYTGSGGRDLKGNKRIGHHNQDQRLTSFNAALARNCFGSGKKVDAYLKWYAENLADADKERKRESSEVADKESQKAASTKESQKKSSVASTKGNQKKPSAVSDGKTGKKPPAVSDEKIRKKCIEAGHNAGDKWKEGLAVRVVRSFKIHKSKYEPGTKYAPKEGFRYDGIYKVTRYWFDVKEDVDEEGEEEQFGLWHFELRRDDPAPAPWTTEGKKRIKEKGLNKIIEEKGAGEPPAKRAKVAGYEVPAEIRKLIEKDTQSASKWEECLVAAENGASAFIEKLKEAFMCPICQDTVLRPASLPCGHFLCEACLDTATKRNCKDCPTCREPMEGATLNEYLGQALEELMLGYGNDRIKKNENKATKKRK